LCDEASAYDIAAAGLETKRCFMKRFLAVVLLVPATLFAQSAFDGTWRADPKSTQYVGHEHFSLQNGLYQCSSCVPKIEVKADGQDHKVSGSPYFDTINVRAVDDHTVEIVTKKGTKPTGTSKVTAAEDGKTLTTEFTFETEGGQKGSGKYHSTRVGTAPQAANKISGEWQPGRLESASESMTGFTYKVTEEGLTMRDQAGTSYAAKFDGNDYPVKGDPGITSVSLKKIDSNTIEETYKRDGKIVTVIRMTAAADGKTLFASVEDRLGGRGFKWTANKQ
jgi:hypothetical protein